MIVAFLAAGPGWAQAQSGADSVSADRVKPVLKSFVVGRDVNITLGSSMSTTIDPGGGWRLTNSLSHELVTFRARDMEEVNNKLMNTASKVISGALAFSLDIGRDYRKKQTLGLARYGKDLIIEDEGAGFTLMLMKPVLGANNSSFSFMGRGSRGLKDFKYDKTLRGSASAYLAYTIGDLLNVSGGAGVFRRRETSLIETIEYKNMPSKADTFNVNVNYGEAESRLLHFSYKSVVGIRRRVMPPRGNSLEIIDAPELSIQEESRVRAQDITVASALKPTSYFNVDFSFDHRIHGQQNKVDTRLSKETERSGLQARTSYQYAATGRASINISTTRNKIDYGPTSISSFEDREYKIKLGIRQKITQLLSVSFSGAASHKQRFFVKKDANPRDADYLHYRGDAGLKAQPFPKFSTNVSFVADRYEVINIDGTLSGDNRVSYLYWAVPKYTYSPTNWLKIAQDFTIKIEFTDFVHKEQENYLNRTTALKTIAEIIIYRHLKFKFTHNYLMRDTGSYTYKEIYIDDEPFLDRSERLYNPTSENLEHGIGLELRYQPSPEFRMWASTKFQDKRSNRLQFRQGSTEREIIPISAYGSGGFVLGFARARRFGQDGMIDLNIAYNRRYGPFLSEEKRQYWDTNATLTYNF